MKRGDLVRPRSKAVVFFRGTPIGILVSDGSPAEAYNRQGVLMYMVLINGGVAFLFEDEIEPVKSEEG